MTETQTTLLKLLSKALFHQSVEVPDINWSDLRREATNHAVLLIAYDALDKSNLPAGEGKQWQDCAFAMLSNNMRVIYSHRLLHDWLTSEEIPYVILKGCSSAFYYPQPLYRSMGDIDFLVPKEQLERASNVLINQGLKQWKTNHPAHIVYSAQGMDYEMHFDLAGMPTGNAGVLISKYLEDIFSKASIQLIGSEECVLPSAFHHGLIILLHTIHHMTGEGVGLRHVCDWAVFENLFSDAEFRDMFEEKLKAVGLWRFAQILTKISIKYLGADEKEWASSDEHLADMLMEDILAGGNFGRKDHIRSMQTMLISDRGKDGIGNRGMVAQFIRSINEIVTLKWPRAKNNKLLLIVGVLFFGTRRLVREMLGKREQTKMKELVTGAANRRLLYQNLQLYVRETP